MMKKVLVIIMSYLVSGLLCFNLSAEDDLADKIHIHRTNPTTRSLIDLPEAIICRELLTVSHNASGVYSLQIDNDVAIDNGGQEPDDDPMPDHPDGEWVVTRWSD